MATAHFSMFGVSSQPSCADADGFIRYSHKDLWQCLQLLRKGKELPRVSEGTRFVAEHTFRIEQWRNNV
jgi:hypothetical protein